MTNITTSKNNFNFNSFFHWLARRRVFSRLLPSRPSIYPPRMALAPLSMRLHFAARPFRNSAKSSNQNGRGDIRQNQPAEPASRSSF